MRGSSSLEFRYLKHSSLVILESKKLIGSGGSFTQGTTVSSKSIFQFKVFESGFLGDGIHSAVSFDKDLDVFFELKKIALSFEDDLDAADAAIFEDDVVANENEGDGDLLRFPDRTLWDSNEGSRFDASFFFSYRCLLLSRAP